MEFEKYNCLPKHTICIDISNAVEYEIYDIYSFLDAHGFEYLGVYPDYQDAFKFGETIIVYCGEERMFYTDDQECESSVSIECAKSEILKT